MANITPALADAFIPELWAASALGALKANTVMVQLVNRDFENIVAKKGDTIHIPKRGTLTVNDKVPDNPVTLQTPNSSTVDVVLDKHKEVSFLVEDVAAAQANQDIINGYIEDGIKGIGEQMDADLLALYTGLSNAPIDGTVDMADPTKAAALIIEARRVLNAAKVSLAGRVAVWHEDAEANLLATEQFTRGNWAPENATALREAELGRKYGFNHFMDQQVITATSQQNILFHRDAFVAAFRPLPPVPSDLGARSSVMNEDGVGLRITWSYNPSYLGIQVTIDILYGMSVMRPEFGVVLTSPAA